MAWFYLLIAAVFEIVWAIGLKFSEGFSRLLPSVITAIAMVASYIFLAAAVKTLPIGTAYAVWTGIGAAGTAILGILLLHEPATLGRVLCIAVIVMGIVGLKVLSGEP